MGGRLNGGPTMADTRVGWEGELGRWLRPFLERLGHKARQRMCPLYVAGLIGPGDRKSVQPMAERFAPGDYDQLHHFVAAGVWNVAPLETELLIQADKLVGGSDAVLVIDDTAMPKKGKHSVGVGAQYASALGKTANCQTLVSLTLARGEVPVTVALRLFLPESWTSDRARLKRAGVPAEHQAARTKPEIALAEIDRMIAAGVHFGCALADAGYGLSAPFLTFCRYQPKTCWPMPSGKTSLGVLARKESSELVLLLSVCVRPTDLRSGSWTRVSNICRGTRPGSSANTARQERRNTISPTSPPRRTCALWLPSSRHDGFANRPTSR